MKLHSLHLLVTVGHKRTIRLEIIGIAFEVQKVSSQIQPTSDGESSDLSKRTWNWVTDIHQMTQIFDNRTTFPCGSSAKCLQGNVTLQYTNSSSKDRGKK